MYFSCVRFALTTTPQPAEGQEQLLCDTSTLQLWKTLYIRIKLYPTASFKPQANRANNLLLLYCTLELKSHPQMRQHEAEA